jgi:hypothetical protein
VAGFGRHSQLVSWLCGGFVILALGVSVLYGHLPIAVLALGFALLPSFVASGFAPTGSRIGLRGSLEVLSAIALGGVLLAQHSVLSFWLVVLGAGYAAASLLIGVLSLIAWRQRRTRQPQI